VHFLETAPERIKTTKLKKALIAPALQKSDVMLLLRPEFVNYFLKTQNAGKKINFFAFTIVLTH
jgi:hypothetical protein